MLEKRCMENQSHNRSNPSPNILQKIFKKPPIPSFSFKKSIKHIKRFFSDFKEFIVFLNSYIHSKLLIFSEVFESFKNRIVKNILIKRGRRHRLFLHTSAMALLSVGVIISPFLSDSNLFSGNQVSFAQETLGISDSIVTDDVFETQRSEKPRDTIITYRVQKGDTISTIAEKFSISEDSIKWENNLKNDNITVGDMLAILPVSGMSHKVKRGDNVYTIAKKYDANAQAIVDYPFNDFADPQTFSLVEGQILIVPEGIKPESAPRIVRQQYIASGPVQVTGGGFTWPLQGSINQYYAWYHKGVDIGASVGAPVVAAHNGTVSQVYNGGWHGGYGVHVIVSGDNGYTTLYSHMSGTNVSPGQQVSAGSSLLGWVGMTGRTTGPHLHFEIRGPGGFFNPLSLL